MATHLSSTAFNPSQTTSSRLAMRPRCLCGPATLPAAFWKPGRYDVTNLPWDQSASIFQIARGWNISRLINGIEFRQYKCHQLPEEALSDLQRQIDHEPADLRQLTRDELQRLMKRYRFTA